ncbi:MAG: OmpA family protein [Flavobacteriaceae bacterium]|nr:OmpA family protein [Flavobacteriaceae bacterium]
MKKHLLILLISSIVMSCVSPKVYKDLENKYADLKRENRRLIEQNEEIQSALTKAKNDLASLEQEYESAVNRRDQLENDVNALRSNLKNLKESYDALEENSSAAIAENSKKNRELLAELEAKEIALANENSRLQKLQKELEQRSQRVAELESLIAIKDQAMQDLKAAISNALIDFEGKGLTVEQRDGKVYVSMENKLLFQSGSWAVGEEGKRAVRQLGEVLAQNPEIDVLIEGHTDNVPYKGTGQVKGNWDLSTKRATAIVGILRENKDINPGNLTAAGRGEYAPVASNESAAGKARNRRIEVILTPKLDEITKLLNDM